MSKKAKKQKTAKKPAKIAATKKKPKKVAYAGDVTRPDKKP